jgi:hypothetical protein
MKLPGGLFWIAMAFTAGIGNYAIKQGVQTLDDQLNDVKRKTAAAESKIHDLTAEWTYLNRPELLADLNRRYLGLVPQSPKQIRASVDDLPMRPPPPPAPEPQIAAATSAPAPTAAPTAPSVAPEPVIRTASAVIPIDAEEAAPAGTPPTPHPAPRPVPVERTAIERASVVRTEIERPKSPTLDALFAQVAGGR